MKFIVVFNATTKYIYSQNLQTLDLKFIPVAGQVSLTRFVRDLEALKMLVLQLIHTFRNI